jgi:uncharacterized protein YegP (UPF0339 family)
MYHHSKITPKLPVVLQWKFYKDTNGQWQWRKFENKKVVAVSLDGFLSRQACIKNARIRGYIET